MLPPPHYEFAALEVGVTVFNELFAARTRQGKQELEEYAVAELPGVSIRRELLEGDPARRIVQYAHDRRANLVVMPTHGYGTFRRFILGSTTAKVLHDADCPVWTGVHLEQAPEVSAIRFCRVVAALDLGAQDPRTLAWAAGLAGALGSELHVVHAMPCIAANAGEAPKAEMAERFLTQARERLVHVCDEAGVKAAGIRVERGDPPQVVCSLAGQIAADLLVIGRGSAAGVFGRLRTNAYAIIRQSPCPVVSV